MDVVGTKVWLSGARRRKEMVLNSKAGLRISVGKMMYLGLSHSSWESLETCRGYSD